MKGYPDSRIPRPLRRMLQHFFFLQKCTRASLQAAEQAGGLPGCASPQDATYCKATRPGKHPCSEAGKMRLRHNCPISDKVTNFAEFW